MNIVANKHLYFWSIARAVAPIIFIYALLYTAKSEELQKSINTDGGCEYITNQFIGLKKVTWSGSCREGKIDGYGILTLEYENRETSYTGNVKLGHVTGRGSLKLGNTVTVGTFVDGNTEGTIHLTYPNGVNVDTYTVGGTPATFGKITTPNYTYVGSTDGTSSEGFGIAEYKSGLRSFGQWSHGKPSGFAFIQMPDKTEAIGIFPDGNPDGHVILRLPNGNTAITHYDKGKMNSIVVINFANGDFYSGKVKNMQPDDIGDYFFKSGQIYSGFWSNGLPSGAGKLTTQTGEVITGTWLNGCLLGDNGSHAVMVDSKTCQK